MGSCCAVLYAITGYAVSDEQSPVIEFPCDYPIKVFGASGADFREIVLAVFHRHAELADGANVREKQSRNGKYTSFTITIVATGEPQLQAIFEDLKATGRVEMVL